MSNIPAKNARLALAAAALLAVVPGCGDDTYMPDELVAAIESTEAAMDSGDGEAACDGVRATMGELERWNEHAMSQLQVLINETLNDLSGVQMSCGLDADGAVDLARMRPAWDDTIDRLRKGTEMDSGWTRVLLWIAGFAAAVLVGAYIRRWIMA